MLSNHPEEVRNFEIVRELEINSSHQGNQKDYLSYSVLDLLMSDKVVEKKGETLHAQEVVES